MRWRGSRRALGDSRARRSAPTRGSGLGAGLGVWAGIWLCARRGGWRPTRSLVRRAQRADARRRGGAAGGRGGVGRAAVRAAGSGAREAASDRAGDRRRLRVAHPARLARHRHVGADRHHGALAVQPRATTSRLRTSSWRSRGATGCRSSGRGTSSRSRAN